MTISSASICGDEVFNPAGETLGEIKGTDDRLRERAGRLRGARVRRISWTRALFCGADGRFESIRSTRASVLDIDEERLAQGPASTKTTGPTSPTLARPGDSSPLRRASRLTRSLSTALGPEKRRTANLPSIQEQMMSKQTNHDSTPRQAPSRTRSAARSRSCWTNCVRFSDERLPGVRERLDALVDAVGQTGSAYANGVRTQTERIASVGDERSFPRPYPGVRACESMAL